MQPTAEEYADTLLHVYKHIQVPGLIDAVEKLRSRLGLNCCEMGDLLGINGSRYSEFIHDKRDLPRRAMVRALALGVPLSSMVKEYGRI